MSVGVVSRRKVARLKALRREMDQLDEQQDAITSEAYAILGITRVPNDWVFDFFYNGNPSTVEKLIECLDMQVGRATPPQESNDR